MRRSDQPEQPIAAKINLTPLIDMVFILLIFFIVTSSFVKESGVEVARPRADSAVPQEHASIFVTVTGEGRVSIEQQNVEVRGVRAQVERLHSQNPEGSVVIVADKTAPTGVVIQVLDQARLAGVSNVAIAASSQER